MKKLPLGIQNFRKIVEGNYIYVDKTQYIYDLINSSSYYFLSRPRRFGKSLLLDTISEVFRGDKELFRGLWIYDSDYSFDKYPVIRLDMSSIANDSPDILRESILSYLRLCYAEEGFEFDSNIPSDAFLKLIILLYKKYDQRVVVLIDEYDKPLLDHLTDVGMAIANRQVIRGFYGILKSMDQYIQLTIITGVSKFTRASIFSELNNLRDITMAKEYAGICGIPTDCLEKYFGEHIAHMKTLSTFEKYDSITDEILAWYDGYTWDATTKLLNPFSLLHFFADKEFGSYWYATGTPRFLIELLKKKPESYLTIKNLNMTKSMLDTFDIDRIELEPLLFQTGYLTVTDIIERKGPSVYVLDLPNYEVRDAFTLQILSALTESGDMRTGQAQIEISQALESGDLQKMLDIMRGLFASIPYTLHVNEEAYYHSIFYAIMTLLGFDLDIEVSTSRGRVDAILELEDKVYIMEFKYIKCPAEVSEADRQKLSDTALNKALNQIDERGYSDRFISSGKAIYKAAFAFLGRDNIEMRVAR